jgi:hypothetical protein
LKISKGIYAVSVIGFCELNKKQTNLFSGVLGILAKPVLVEFLLASCGLGALWGFMEAFLFIHIGTYNLSIL